MELKSNGIIGQSASLAGVFKILGKVAPTDSTVLVIGNRQGIAGAGPACCQPQG